MTKTLVSEKPEKTLAEWLAENAIEPPEFAKRIGVSRWSVDRYVRGLRTPRWPVILKIQKATNGEVGPGAWANQTPKVSVLRPRRRREPIAA